MIMWKPRNSASVWPLNSLGLTHGPAPSVNEDEYYDYEDGESDDYPMETIRLDDTDQESDLDSELDRMERGM